MSIELTNKKPSMVDSQTLKLVQSSAQVSQLAASYLSKQLKAKGYSEATTTNLNFLSTLECGVNYASELARSMGVSRQMIAKNVKQLCLAGYLKQENDIGKQKKILFTYLGEQLMSDARQLLAEVDELLIQQEGKEFITETIASLEHIQNLLFRLDKS